MKKLIKIISILSLILLVACAEDDIRQIQPTPELLPGEEFIEGNGYNEEFSIETPFITFNRSDLWGRDINIRTEDEEGKYILEFVSYVKEQEVELFSLIFTQGEADGFMLGTIFTEDNKNINIYVDISTIEKDSTWTEEEFKNLNIMQEYVNEIITQLNENDSFTPVGN